MKYTVNQLYQILFERVNAIHSIFNATFREEFVDLQYPLSETQYLFKIKRFLATSGCTKDKDDFFEVPDSILQNIKESFRENAVTIYIWWPKVTVTNENERSVDIQDLYAKIDFTLEGRIPYENTGFLLNRATFSREQFLSNYLHSHIKGIPRDDFSQFMRPCLGDGPIRGTINTLKNNYEEITWMMFCRELALYVTVESLRGGPWIRLENISFSNEIPGFSGYSSHSNSYHFVKAFSTDVLKDFIKYYLENGHLSISYINRTYVSGMAYHEYIIDVSNAFISYYNTFLKTTKDSIIEYFNTRLLFKTIIINNKFFREGEFESFDINRYQGQHVLTFKGNDITTTIIEPIHSDATVSIVLSNDVAMYILNSILKVINYKYENKYNLKFRGEQETSPTYKKCYYL